MLSQTAVYALRAMGYIAAHGDKGPVLARTISEAMAIPRNYLSKIAHRLVQAGLLKSVRGTNGGFTLTRPADQISLGQVAALFANLDNRELCFLQLHECDGTCNLHRDWEPLVDHFEQLLDRRTIDQVFTPGNIRLQT
jgi:Rrf2 family protein